MLVPCFSSGQLSSGVANKEQESAELALED